MKPLALSATQQRRLKKLARDAGRTPAQMLKFVLRDGFDFCEWGAIPSEQVQREAQRIIDAARARKSRKAA